MFIDDPCEVYVTNWHVARKPHRCECCGYTIPAGAQYRRDHMVIDGTASDEACCWACGAMLWQLLRDYNFAPSPTYAMEFLREEVDQYRSDKIRLRPERNLLAGILRRNRDSRRLTTSAI